MNTDTTTQTTAKEAVLSFLKAMNEEDFDKARTYVSDHMTFKGVMGSRNGADEYFKDMKKMKLKYDIKKVFQEGNDVSVFYNIDMSGTTIFSSGWYYVKNDGKIDSFRVVFDPRPLLEKSETKK